MTNSIQITTGNDAQLNNFKNVEGDNTEISAGRNILDVPLLEKLLKENGFNNSQIDIDNNLHQLQTSEPELFQKSLEFFLDISKGVTVRWLSQMILG